MKRLLAYLLLLFFGVVSTANAQSILMLLANRNFKTLTFNSVTGYLDDVTGFYTGGSLDLRPYVGRFATFTASAGNTIKFKIGQQSAGGETYGSNLSNYGSMETNAGWVADAAAPTSQGQSSLQKHSGSYSWQFVTSASGQGIISQASGSFNSTTAGGLYLLGAWVYPTTLTSFNQYITDGQNNNTLVNKTITGLTAGAWNYSGNYYTNTYTGTATRNRYHSTGSDTYYVDDVTLTQVLTPSNGAVTGTYGCLFNGAGTVTGAPYNAASYTVTVTAS